MSDSNAFNLKDIKKAEELVESLLHASESDWKKVARIAITVRDKELFKSEYKSFTAWVKAIANKCERQPSLFWRYIKAGKYYLQTIGSSDIDDIDSATIAPEVLVNLEKVQRHAPTKVFEDIKEKALAGQLTVKDSRVIEREYRPLNPGENNRGGPTKKEEGQYEHLGKNKYQEQDQGQVQAQEDENIDNKLQTESSKRIESTHNKELKEIAPIILESLRTQNNLVDWIKKCASMKYPAKYFSSHSEVRVNFERSRLRLDLVTIVRWSFKRPKDIFIVEIKSNLHDFESDNKWEKYLNFANFFCFAIPDDDRELIEAVEQNTFNFVGILLINLEDKSITMHRKPIKRTPEYSYLLYENLYERALGWSGSD